MKHYVYEERQFGVADADHFLHAFANFINDSDILKYHFGGKLHFRALAADNADDADNNYDDAITIIAKNGIQLDKKLPKPNISNLYLFLINYNTNEKLALSIKGLPQLSMNVDNEDQGKLASDITRLQELLNYTWNHKY